MKKVLLFALAGVVALTSCNKNDDKTTDGAFTIRATVENGNAYNSLISGVNAYIYVPSPSDEDGSYVIASANYTNGGFTLTLPAQPADRFFYSIEEEYDSDEITVSDKDARLMYVDGDFETFNSADRWVGSIAYCLEIDDRWSSVFYFYADRDVTVTGTVIRDNETTITVNLSLKKGWNTIYFTETGNSEDGWSSEYTTTPVSGLKWIFWPDEEDDDDEGASGSSLSKQISSRGVSAKKK